MAGAHDVLRTRRLVLRPPVPSDAPALAAAIGNYDVVRWLGRVPYPYGLNDAARFIAGAGEKAGRVWLIEQDGRVVGGISADHELGYWLSRDVWGRGLATEACDAVVDAWFADGSAPPLPSAHYMDNRRSARVLIKQGFRYDGLRKVEARALSQTVISRTLILSRDDWERRRRYRLTTRRLRLREMRDGDLPALMQIAGQESVARMLFNVTLPWPEVDARRWLDDSRFRGRLGFRAAICRLGRVIGTVGIGGAPGTSGVSCMFFLDPACWGRGYMSEVLPPFLADTMDRFHVATVRADHFADNPASGAVLRRAGFVQTGTDTGISAARTGAAAMLLYRLDRAALRHP